MKFAFWNVHQNPVINHYIVDLIYENELDIIVLAEYKDNDVWLYSKSNARKSKQILFNTNY